MAVCQAAQAVHAISNPRIEAGRGHHITITDEVIACSNALVDALLDVDTRIAPWSDASAETWLKLDKVRHLDETVELSPQFCLAAI